MWPVCAVGGLAFAEVSYKLVDAVNRHVPSRLGSK